MFIQMLRLITFFYFIQLYSQTLASQVPVVSPETCPQLKVSSDLDSSIRTSTLNSKDCQTHYILPANYKTPKFNVYYSANTALCSSLNGSYTVINKLSETAAKLTKKMSELDLETASEETLKQYNLYLQQIRNIRKLENEMYAELKQFADIEGANLAVLLDSSIKQNDIDKLLLNNKRDIYKVNRNGKRVFSHTELPNIKLPIMESSTYSFSNYTPDARNGSDSIISLNFPGFEVFQQKDTKTPTVHVKAGNTLAGNMTLSLLGVCDPNNEETGVRKANFITSVNRSFSVQQQFTYGYNATLNLKRVIEQIKKEMSIDREKSFTKKQIVGAHINTQIDQLLEFKWNEEISVNFDAEKVLQIKTIVFNNLIDKFLSKLESDGVIEVTGSKAIDNAKGGYIDTPKLGYRCRTVSKWFGAIKSKRCENFIYTVKQWKDGVNENIFEKYLSMNGQFVEKVEANQMLPVFYSVAFSNIKEEGL